MSAQKEKQMSIRFVKAIILRCGLDPSCPHEFTVTKVYLFEDVDKCYAYCPVHNDLMLVVFKPFVLQSGIKRDDKRK